MYLNKNLKWLWTFFRNFKRTELKIRNFHDKKKQLYTKFGACDINRGKNVSF